MPDFVSDWRASVVAGVASVTMLWAFFVVPGGAPWTGLAWMIALGVLLLLTPVLFLRRASPSAELVRDVAVPPSTHRGQGGVTP